MSNTNDGQPVSVSSAQERKILRFQKVAPPRVDKVVRSLQILGRCGNRLVYEYSDEQMTKIFAHIDKCVQDMKSKFRQKEKETSPKFKF